MKSILFFVLFISSFSFAQQERTVSIEKSQEMASFRQDGEFHFKLPENITAEQVNRAAAYYTKNFAVSFDSKKHDAVLKMVENDAQNRKIIKRFFVSLNIDRFQLNDQVLTLEEFYEKELK